ncbi:uncharacterized protein LACBIDRAFT_307932 [Laccaria bicolor S238N-H82]|uniref:Predicted protein n=1 Tax=Laccaria bicolor (strain S238N-H82 / ATCC MYA-4686) TaxID=486041 RepID=B0DR85_LACBS|nr:uncharacterized protein LACBIDRAFT_307932 [Laccaria bicolor S238N-H82]EDR02829.1 predicted protein [Laccaria bicolor S238N-H82]|eukprot:XP_001886539.1 predicted protein [Laccaria bicolor S238N-H82]
MSNVPGKKRIRISSPPNTRKTIRLAEPELQHGVPSTSQRRQLGIGSPQRQIRTSGPARSSNNKGSVGRLQTPEEQQTCVLPQTEGARERIDWDEGLEIQLDEGCEYRAEGEGVGNVNDAALAMPQEPDIQSSNSMFVEEVFDEHLPFWQLTETFFVANGWDVRARKPTARWYHVQISGIGDELIVSCMCPASTSRSTGLSASCFHIKFLLEYLEVKFPRSSQPYPLQDDSEVILFSRERGSQEGIWINHFSIPSTDINQTSLKARAVVQFDGDDEGTGSWACSKDSGQRCPHIAAASKFMMPDLGEDDRIEKASSDMNAQMIPRRRLRGKGPISYLPIPPPLWARIPSDPDFPQCTKPVDICGPPPLIMLTSGGTCHCANPRPEYDSSRPLRTRKCVIYGLNCAWESMIEVQPCGTCAKRNIGPDCQDLGLFNYDNDRLVTHALMDDYTSAYTVSEQTFTSWVTLLTRRYETMRSNTRFLTEGSFLDIWFAYVQLQCFDGDMICGVCGPTPEDTIWDGVTLAYGKKHVLPTLRPPTIIPDDAPSRGSRYVRHQQAIPGRDLRDAIRRVCRTKVIRLVITDMQETTENLQDVEEGEDEEQFEVDRAVQQRKAKAEKKSMEEYKRRLDDIPMISKGLAEVCSGLQTIFLQEYGMPALDAGSTPNDSYRLLLLHLAAEESVLQMANRPALKDLAIFVTEPTMRNASALVKIPALHGALRHEFAAPSGVSQTLLEVAHWLYKRGKEILQELIQNNSGLPERCLPSEHDGEDWIETGCCYSMRPIRLRPAYPNLKHDVRGDFNGQRGHKCSKYWDLYGKGSLTGGLMCVWCPHSVCYGFHNIPKGEGRNDVFSAIVTRWEKAPKRIIYDFACALGPYCMTREPQFFADTQFAVDGFHAKDHTKCSSASFLSTYTNIDPRLKDINTSAAECGNSGIKRMRKSVRWMSQDRAIIYAKIFLSVWNRNRIRAMDKKSPTETAKIEGMVPRNRDFKI